MFSAAKNAVKHKFHELIDAQMTKLLRPFLVSGQGPDGQECSDIVVNEDSDISIENMILKSDVLNEHLNKMSVPMRVELVCAERVFFDIPWGNIYKSDAQWKLEIDGLMIVVTPLERDGWNPDFLRQAKETAVQAAVAGLVKKLKQLDAKPKKPTFIEGIVKRLMDHVNLTVHIRNVHLRLERANGDGTPGSPPFSVGFVLPSCDVETSIQVDGSLETVMSVARAGVYCKAGTVHGEAVASTVVTAGGTGDQPALEEVYAMRERMGDKLREWSKAPDSEWLVVTTPCKADATMMTGDGQTSDPPAALRANIKMDNSNRSNPANFDYEAPIQQTKVDIGVVAVQVSDAQGAALLSLGAHASQYKLWAAYGVTRRALKLPKSGKSHPRLLWRASARAVTASLHKAKVGVTDLTTVLKDARSYRLRYIELLTACLQQGQLTVAHISSPKGVAKAVAKLDDKVSQPLLAALETLEDVLPVGTLAWCRLTTQESVKNGRKPKRGASVSQRESAGEEDEEEGEEDDLTRVMDATPAVDPRLLAAPKGYVNLVVDVHFERFSLQLLRSMTQLEQAQLKATRLMPAEAKSRSRPRSYAVELMQLDVNTIRARQRIQQGDPGSSASSSSTMAMFITSIEAADATALGRPLFIDMAGTSPDDPDELLGGPVEYNGDIAAALEQRRRENSGIVRRAAARAYSAAASRMKPAATDLLAAVSAKSTIAVAPTAPALIVTSLNAKAETTPNEVALKVGLVDVVYLPPFWADLEAYLHVLERVKWSSQLGGTAMLRVRHPRIYRSIDNLMREGWHTPRMKIMTPFLELSDVMGLPSWKHKLDVALSGLVFTLRAEKDTSEELMRVSLPPMAIHKTPKVGLPQPEHMNLAISFDGSIEARSPVQRGLFGRVMGISVVGGAYKALSRLHGTRDTLTGEVIALNNHIASLHAEVERLQMAHEALNSQVMLKTLETTLLETSTSPSGADATLLSPRGPTAASIVNANNEAMKEQITHISSSIAQLATAMQHLQVRSKRSSWYRRLSKSRASSLNGVPVSVANVSP